MTKIEELGIQVLKEVVHIDRQLSETAAIYEVGLVQSLITAAESEGFKQGKAEGTEQERERIRKACREFRAGDTLVINAPTLLLEFSVLRPKRKK